MTQNKTFDAATAIQEAISTIPTDLDARSHFFVQWRARTITALELAFGADEESVRQFKEIEFSPRLLTRDQERDAQRRLDAWLSGCAAARALLEMLMRRLAAEMAAPLLFEMPRTLAPPEAATTEKTEAPATTAPSSSASGEATPPSSAAAQPPQGAAPVEAAAVQAAPVEAARLHAAPGLTETAQPTPIQAAPVATAPVEAAPVETAPVAEAAPHQAAPAEITPIPVVASTPARDVERIGAMPCEDICAPVRGSLARMLGAWERGDRAGAAVVSGQLLVDLTLLARHERFKNSFEQVISKAVAPEANPGSRQTLHAQAPACFWSLLVAMNEVMRG